MASCMQHLYMMPQARASILSADTDEAKHESTLKELQRMFAYLLVSISIFFMAVTLDDPHIILFLLSRGVFKCFFF